MIVDCWEFIFWYLDQLYSMHCAHKRNYTNVHFIFFTEDVVNEFVAIVLILV